MWAKRRNRVTGAAIVLVLALLAAAEAVPADDRLAGMQTTAQMLAAM